MAVTVRVTFTLTPLGLLHADVGLQVKVTVPLYEPAARPLAAAETPTFAGVVVAVPLVGDTLNQLPVLEATAA